MSNLSDHLTYALPCRMLKLLVLRIFENWWLSFLQNLPTNHFINTTHTNFTNVNWKSTIYRGAAIIYKIKELPRTGTIGK
jgi:hypothetical protein